MRRLLLVALLVAATPCFGAVQYEFTQVTRSDSQLAAPVRLIGRAVVEGDRSRVDYLEGSTAGAGSYVVSTNGSRDLLIVDPSTQTFARRHATDASRRLDTLGVKISNLKLELGDSVRGPNIAGYPTTYWRLIATFDITVMIGSIPISQHVTTTIEKWTTEDFGDVLPSFFVRSPYQTGDSELDRLIEAETTRISGFPLRQVITVSSRLADQGRAAAVNASSRNQRTEVLVTSIVRSTVQDSFFQVPPGFREASEVAAEKDPGGVHILSMTEESKKDER